METKPYSLQAPEQIAKEYAGNKQKIGQAAKMGLLDPTAAVLAGMFIDRMRTAQIQEQGPQQTVAQQVLSPTVPPMSPQAPGAPPPGAPPQAGLGAIAPQGGGMPPPPPPPQGPVGMAAGGYVGDENFGSGMVNGNYGSMGAPFNVGQSQQNNGAMFSNGMPQDGGNETFNNGLPRSSGGYAGGGLSAIDLPPEMFDEPRNGGFNNGFNNSYAGGGIVAFAEAGEVNGYPGILPEEEQARLNAIYPQGGFAAPIVRSRTIPRPAAKPKAPASAPKTEAAAPAPAAPQDPYAAMIAGAGGSQADTIDSIRKMMGADTPQPGRDALRADIAQRMSPETQRKDKEELMWTTLAQIGAGMASTKSSSFLQAAGDAMQAALPGMIAEKKAQKADLREALKDQAALEGMDRQEQREYVRMGLDLHSQNQQLLMKAKELAQQGKIEEARLALQKYGIDAQTAASMAGIGVQRAALDKPTADEIDAQLYAKDPTAYEARWTAKYAGRPRAAASGTDALLASRLFGGGLEPAGGGGSTDWKFLGTE